MEKQKAGSQGGLPAPKRVDHFSYLRFRRSDERDEGIFTILPENRN